MPSVLEELIIVLIPAAFVLIVLLLSYIGKAAKKQGKNYTQRTAYTPAARPAPKAADIFQNPAARYERPKAAPTITVPSSKPAPGHAIGGKVETVPSIVGSLGEHNDEGCNEHANVRFLATEPDEEGETKPDYDKIAAAIVFGSVLAQPKGDDTKYF